MKLIGPFSQIISLQNIYLKGPLKDAQLHIIKNGGVVIEEGIIREVGDFETLASENPHCQIEEITVNRVLLPGFIDCHTHICYAGNRAQDFAMRNAGETYLEIAQRGGGINSTVESTRKASEEELVSLTVKRANRHIQNGVTTIEVKSGYGLTEDSELKMLRAIQKANQQTPADLISTCLAAHLTPKDFDGNNEKYLEYILTEILPKVQQENLAKRVDIFVEQTAFSPKEAKRYLDKAMQMGFQSTVHADQFTTGGSDVAVEVGADSADHLEHSSDKEIKKLAQSPTSAVALPGASIGLGEPLAPARKLLDAGASLAIASDWNPGSAPQGNLLMQASVLATYQKLSTAEVFAGITFRAANALRIINKGRIMKGMVADLQAYATKDYREILYHQGMMTPSTVWKNGQKVMF